ncbi:MAG TPA: septum formation initiator family protein [Acidimicrobiales bacterium]|nr:septum formation initiator family protein [Acidimicrobiales bacterium]
MNRLRRVLGVLAVTVALVAILALAVFPTRGYLDQRRQLDLAQRRVELLAQQNDQLSKRVDRLHTDAEIERLAREQYHLVRPGEEAYAVLPSVEEIAEDPQVPKRAPVVHRSESLWSKVRNTVVFWD